MFLLGHNCRGLLNQDTSQVKVGPAAMVSKTDAILIAFGWMPKMVRIIAIG
tara:strand:+ start:6268 stop:6420 length:153 start_codon:yes stop_codon:yes gene_type:complete